MNKIPFAKQVLAAAGVLFLCAEPGLSRAQTAPPGGVTAPQTPSPAARPGRNTPPPDYFAGLTLTDDQKAKIEQIRQNSKSRRDAVLKDNKLSPEAKDAMLRGYRRMENNEIFMVLTPEQQKEVRKRVLDRRAAQRPAPAPRTGAPQPQPQQQQEEQKQKSPPE